jgi:SAM-dependent methyltransferase
MDSFDPASFGDHFAEVYDEMHPALSSSDPMIQALAKLACGGPVLELGVGTGRVALPLSSLGITVHGIEASEKMVARLRAKPDGSGIPVTMGDFRNVRGADHYSLIFCVQSTFFSLPSQADQLECLKSCASHLRQDGAILLEAFSPDPSQFEKKHNMSILDVQIGRVTLDVSHHDTIEQKITMQHLIIMPTGIKMYPVQLRYAWPSELDLMARISGLVLEDRRGGWKGEDYAGAGGRHVSIYRKRG